jgi:hypothetical protein
MFVNSQQPVPGSSDVIIGGSTFLAIDVFSALGTPEKVILIGGVLGCGAVPVPWGGSLDFSAGSALIDGFGMSVGPLDAFASTPFSLFLSTGGSGLAAGQCAGTVQCIVTDPTNPIFPLRNSIAIQMCGDLETVYTLGDDANVQHTLSVANPINFCGGSYTQLYVGSNGVVSFGSGSNDFTETMPDFFNGFGTIAPNPGVAVCYSDLNNGGTSSGATYAVIEGPNGVTVEYRNQNHWAPNEPAGTFSCTFIDNSWSDTRLDYSGFIPATVGTDNVIIGVSDGDNTVGSDTDLSDGLGTGIANAIGSYASISVLAPDAVGELIPANTPIGFSTCLFFENGAPGSCDWSIFP